MTRVVVVCAAVTVIEAVFYGVLAPLLPRFAHQFSLSSEGAGLLVGSYMIGMLASILPTRAVLRRGSARGAVIGGLLTMAIATIGFATASDAIVLIGMRLVQGAGAGVAWTGALAWLSQAAPADRRGRLLGNALAATFVGNTVGPLVGAVAIALGVVVTMAGLSALAAVLAAVVARTESIVTAGPLDVYPPASTMLSRRGIPTLTVITVVSLGSGARSVLVPLELSTSGASAGGISATFAGGALMMAVTSWLTGRAVDKRAPLTAILVGVGTSAAVLWLLAFAHQVGSIAALAIALGVGVQIAMTAAIVRWVGESERVGIDDGTSWSYVNLCWTGGLLAGSLLTGWISQAASDGFAWTILAALCVGAGTSVVLPSARSN